MLLLSKSPTLWRRLYERFRLIQTPGGERGYVSSIVFPVTDADRLVRTAKIVAADTTITGTGEKTVLTVPAEKRWRVWLLTFSRNGGDWTATQFKLNDASETKDIPLPAFTAASSAQHEFQNPVQLEPGDFVELVVNAGTTWGDIQAKAWVEEEDV